MKKILIIFLLLSSIAFSETRVNWSVNRTPYPDKFRVECDLTGDIFSFFSVEIEPFSDYSISSNGEDYDIPSEIKLRVEKQPLNSNDETAYYVCYLEKDFETLLTYRFKIERIYSIKNW